MGIIVVVVGNVVGVADFVVLVLVVVEESTMSDFGNIHMKF